MRTVLSGEKSEASSFRLTHETNPAPREITTITADDAAE